jgi:hypothetical protein
MAFQKNLAFWEKLFDLVSVEDDNQTEITQLLESFDDKITLEEIINTPSSPQKDHESMLMWAVWRLKKQTVIDLLKFGANPKFVNNREDSVSTYWRLGWVEISENQEKIACDIAQILHGAGVNLSRRSIMTHSLVKNARKNELKMLCSKLKELGY